MAEAFCPMCEMRIMTMATSIFTGMIGKRKASHVWKFFGQMTTTILANNLSFDLLPLSEIRTKSKKMAWLPEPRSDLVSSSITSMLCVVWSRTVGESEMQITNNFKKVLHMLFMWEDQISNPLQCLYYNAPSVGGDEMERSRAI
jgi:hypothetical protein